MSARYSQKQLRTSIVSEKQPNKTLYYSIAKKEQKNFSFLKNERLFILDFDEGKIYYSNETKNLPFKENLPQPKNEFAQVETTKLKHQPNTNEIEFTFPFNKENLVWKFIFDTNELADEWVKMIEFQKQSQIIKEKDLKSLNKAIFEMPKIEKENANDIVKEPQRDIANDESRLLNQMIGVSRVRPSEKTESEKNRRDIKNSKNYSDWNKRFYRERNLFTLYEFQRAATEAFYSGYNKDHLNSQPIRTYESESFIVKIADKFTQNAKNLKNEYRNYHFIIDATNKKPIVGVPLTCLIEYEGVVSLIKARFPDKVSIISFDDVARNQIQQLERYTRIKNRILQNCKIMNLVNEYDSKNSKDLLLYVDNVQEYLPLNTEFILEQTLIRPEYLLDSVDYFVYSGNPDKIGKTQLRQLRQLGLLTVDKAKEFSNSFYKDTFPICKISELKNLIHEAGLNLKSLPYLYNNCTNQHVKRHIYSAMTAKIVKDYIFENTIKIRSEGDQQIPFKRLIEDVFTVLLEGNNNRSHELWKEISMQFKKKYNIILNHKEILPGFFFNSIMDLVPGIYEVAKINKRKKIFEEIRVIESGFVTQTLPKVKSYERFLPENIEYLKMEAKEYIKSQDVCQKILNQLFNQKDHKYQTFYTFGNNDEWMTEYLSLYYPPDNLASENQDKIKMLYDRVNEEPPSYFTLNLTKHYLEWCNKKEITQQFKVVFERAMAIADYWLDETHPMRSDLFECLSDYYSIIGVNEDMLKYMKESLNICIKFWGSNSSQTGIKQYELADRFLRAGKKKDALECFFKAKENMEQNKTKTNKLGLALMKISSIYLSDLQYEKAVEFAQLSIKSFQEYEKRINSYGIYNEPYKIKSFQILGRVFQICDRRTEYKDLALSCAKKFNNTKNQQVFEQMIRICLASAIFKSNNERCESFIKLLKTSMEEQRENPSLNHLTPIQQLMKMSDDVIVMERFIYRFEHFERSLFELSVKKRQLADDSKEFLGILRNVVAVVGYDYIKGLVEEKICYGN